MDIPQYIVAEWVDHLCKSLDNIAEAIRDHTDALKELADLDMEGVPGADDDEGERG